MRILFFIGFWIVSSAYGLPYCGFDDLAPGPSARGLDTAVRDRYFVNGNAANPVSFGFELSLLVENNPTLALFYRPPAIPEAKWLSLSTAAKNRAILEAMEATELRTPVLVRTRIAPEYLAEHALKEGPDRIELADNGVSESLRETQKRLRWVEAELRIDNIHAHAAYLAKGVNIEGVEHFMKFEADLSQTNTLTQGYKRYLERGRVPANNMAHWSTGPIDLETRNRVAELARNPEVPVETLDPALKGLFAVTYRPDLYGEGRVGHEVRNAGKRVDEVFTKLHLVARRLEIEKFAAYTVPEIAADPAILTPEALGSLPMPLRGFLGQVEHYLRYTRNPRRQRGGAPYAVRFAYPTLPWTEHPLIRVLSPKDRQAFMDRLRPATEAYVGELAAIKATDHPIEKKTELVQIALARWAHDSGIHASLVLGKQALSTAEREAFYPKLGEFKPAMTTKDHYFFELGGGWFGTVYRKTSRSDAREEPVARKVYRDSKNGDDYPDVMKNDMAALGMLREGSAAGAFGFEVVEMTPTNQSVTVDLNYVRGRELRSLVESELTSEPLKERVIQVYTARLNQLEKWIRANHEIALDRDGKPKIVRGNQFGLPELIVTVIDPKTGERVNMDIKADNVVVLSSLVAADPAQIRPSPSEPEALEVTGVEASFPLRMVIIDPF